MPIAKCSPHPSSKKLLYKRWGTTTNHKHRAVEPSPMDTFTKQVPHVRLTQGTPWKMKQKEISKFARLCFLLCQKA